MENRISLKELESYKAATENQRRQMGKDPYYDLNDVPAGKMREELAAFIMVVGTVLLSQTERTNKGILKMLVLPISTTKLCLAKFVVLLVLAAAQILMMTGMYYISAAICTAIQDYSFILLSVFVAKEIGFIFVSAIPMIAFFWMLSVCIQTPIFSVGIGLTSIVPSVLMINTKVWFAYPMDYPFFVITSEYGKLAANLDTTQVKFIPWIPAAVAITIVCLGISCLCFGQAERK